MSRAWLGVFVSVTLVSLLAEGVVAQGGPQFTISAKVDQAAKTIEKDLGNVVFPIDISVNPTQAQNPLNSQFTIRLELALEPASPPNGYALALGVPAECQEPDVQKKTTCTVAPSKQIQVVVTVSAIISDPDTESVPFKLRIKSTPVFAGQSNPVTEGAIAAMQQSDEESVGATANLKLDASERVSSFVKRYPWFMIAGAAGIVLISVVLIRKRRGGLSVATDSPVQEVLPGRGASFPLQVTNEGPQKEGLSLTTSDVPAGWSAILPVDKIELGPNETTTIWLTLKAPASAQPGEHIQVNFVATSTDGGSAESLVEAVVVERYGVRVPSTRGAPAAYAAPQRETDATAAEPEPQVARVAPKRRRD